MPLRPVLSVESFLSATDERYFANDRFMVWRNTSNRMGFHIYGNQCHLSFGLLGEIMDRFVGDGERQCLLIDNTFCTDVSLSTYVAAAHFWVARRARQNEFVEKLAVVVSEGIVGTLVAGLAGPLNMTGAIRVFTSLGAATHWLGCDAPEVFTEELRQLDRQRQEIPLVERLHSLLRDERFSMNVRQAARRLGMSERTLQRRLSNSGTTFQAEVSRAKLAQAQELMLTGRLSLTAIAVELGFASLQHFSARFRAVHGLPPRSWLRARREGSSDVRAVSV